MSQLRPEEFNVHLRCVVAAAAASVGPWSIHQRGRRRVVLACIMLLTIGATSTGCIFGGDSAEVAGSVMRGIGDSDSSGLKLSGDEVKQVAQGIDVSTSTIQSTDVTTTKLWPSVQASTRDLSSSGGETDGTLREVVVESACEAYGPYGDGNLLLHLNDNSRNAHIPASDYVSVAADANELGRAFADTKSNGDDKEKAAMSLVCFGVSKIGSD